MKTHFSFRLVVMSLAITVVAGCVPFSARPMPDIRGRESVSPGPSAPVEIIRDRNGIPHITAESRLDAYFGQGYAHAQDRFFQMEFWRRIGQGRLSELFGKSVVASDVYLRTMNFAGIARQEYEMAPEWFKEALDAYADGVNAYIAGKKPGQLSFEFSLLKVQGVEVEIEPWEPWQSLAWGKVMCQDLGSDLEEELLRLDVLRAVGTEMAADYFSPFRYDEHPTILLDEELPVVSSHDASPDWISTEVAELAFSAFPTERINAIVAGVRETRTLGLGHGLGLGSNGWVVSGDHTQSGKPILSNDMHLGIQMPSIWYEVTLHYPAPDGRQIDLHGVSFAGVPGIIVGHSSSIGWGFTVGYADEQDLYLERINPTNANQYLAGSEWHDMDIRVERIEVSGEDEPVFVTVRSTRNGPIVSDHGGYATYGGFYVEPVQLFPTDMQMSALSLKWTALEPGATVQAVLQMNEARNFDEFRESLKLWNGPSLAIVCADVEGNFGYQLPGRLPIRGAGTGALPAPGWDDDYQWQGFIPFEELPSVKNPDRGYVVVANNPAVGPAYPYPLSYTLLPAYRGLRITEMLKAAIGDGGVTNDDMVAAQQDVLNLSAREILPFIASLPKSSVPDFLASEHVVLPEEPDEALVAERTDAALAAIDLVADWDLQMNTDSAQAALFFTFYVELISRVMRDDFSPDLWDTGRVTHGATMSQNMIELLLREPENEWWDNRWTTGHTETRDEILAQTLSAAYLILIEQQGDNPEKWRLGDTHGATFRNQTLGKSGIGLIENMFNRGPYETPGGLDQVRRSGVKLSDPTEVSSIASMRMVVDLDDVASCLFIHPTGQSGHIRSRHYDDFIDEWVDGEYFTRPYTDEQIRDEARQRLILE